jgi:hypothetical protein
MTIMRLLTYFLPLLLSTLTVRAGFAAADQGALIECAKKDGSLVFCASMTADQAEKVLAAFKTTHPFIQPQIFRAVGERLLTKIMTEVRAPRS